MLPTRGCLLGSFPPMHQNIARTFSGVHAQRVTGLVRYRMAPGRRKGNRPAAARQRRALAPA
jgi:hypothetical protein